MSGVAQQEKQVITLKGSTALVTEFFSYSINSILYQRGIYPPETFDRVNKYGLGMLITSDPGLKDYLKQVLEQLSGWLMDGQVQRLVLVITGADSKQVLERWVFQIDTEKDSQGQACMESSKPIKEITAEIQSILRQITASVTFLPLLNEPCTFDLLVYADKEADVPSLWEETDPCIINDSTEVRLRSFTTKVHKVDTMVAYKNPATDV